MLSRKCLYPWGEVKAPAVPAVAEHQMLPGVQQGSKGKTNLEANGPCFSVTESHRESRNSKIFQKSHRSHGGHEIQDEHSGPARWLSRERSLLPNLRTWVQPLGPEWWLERTDSPRLTSDFHMHTIDTGTINNSMQKKDEHINIKTNSTKHNVTEFPPFPPPNKKKKRNT